MFKEIKQGYEIIKNDQVNMNRKQLEMKKTQSKLKTQMGGQKHKP